VNGRRPYVRPVARFWWARKPYLAYTLREATGVAVAGYGIVLLAGLVSLARGEPAYNEWLEFLRTRSSVALHLVLLVAMIVHTWTWFRIMPKTMPRLVIAGRVVPQRLITNTGLVLAIAGFLLTLLATRLTQPWNVRSLPCSGYCSEPAACSRRSPAPPSS
jgi:fumarate reductase subunit C